MTIKIINKITKIINQNLKGLDKEFFNRVYTTGFEIYLNRIKAIGFTGMDRVLDAGCGFGQWSIGLAQLNSKVYSIDKDVERIRILKSIKDKLKCENIIASTRSIEKTDYPLKYFDGIFCYSSIYFTDFKKSIKEFSRILKRKGKLYICANGLGWYIYNLINKHNKSCCYDPRQMAIDCLINTLEYYTKGKRHTNQQLVIPSEILIQELKKNKIKVVGINGEGLYNESARIKIKPFFDFKYYGVEGVYEIIGQKI